VASSGKARRIARSILVYLARNPGAKDSLEGMRWWIERADECSDVDIEDAVQILLSRGLLSCWDVTRMAHLKFPSRLELNRSSALFGLSPEFLSDPDQALRAFDLSREE
jgi:hypothetical protein